jgi:flagellar capping protein FliD
MQGSVSASGRDAIRAALQAARTHGQPSPAPEAQALKRLRRISAQHAGQRHLSQTEGEAESTTSDSARRDDLRYRVPLGETGIGQVDGASRQNALVRLFAFEKQHAAAHRRRLQAHGVDPDEVQTIVRFQHGPDGEGDLVPVAATTESHADHDADGLRELVGRELAIIRAADLIRRRGPTAFGLHQRPLPLVRHAATIASTYRVMQNREEIRRMAEEPGIVEMLQELDPKQLRLRRDAITPVQRELKRLDQALRSLVESPDLSALAVQTDAPALEATVADRTATGGTYRIRIEGLAQAHTVESAAPGVIAAESEALGWSGTFGINGFDISVEKEDSLLDIAAKVNAGEDLNRDGVLDPGEDTNGNARLDDGPATHGVTASVSGGRLHLSTADLDAAPPTSTDPDQILQRLQLPGGRFRINGVEVKAWVTDTLQDLAERITHGEDANRNDRLDPGEDTNRNGRLDGGVEAHGVRATVMNERLRIQRTDAGAQPIEVDDPDGVLAAYGMVRRDEQGELLFSNEITAPAAARLRVNEQLHTRGSNELTDVIRGIRLRLRETTEHPVEVRVLDAPERLERSLRKVIEPFNRAMRTLNDALQPREGVLRDSEHLVHARTNITGRTREPVAGQPPELRTAGEAGLEVRPDGLQFVSQQLDSALLSLRRAMATGRRDPLQRQTSAPSVYQDLGRLGIAHSDDGTLQFRPDRFRTAFAASPEDVRSLFGGEDGWVPRLSETIHDAVRTDGGYLAWARTRAEGLLELRERDGLNRLVDGITAASVIQPRRLLGSLKA